MEPHLNFWGLTIGLVLVSMTMHNVVVEAHKACSANSVEKCSCTRFDDCPLHGECLEGNCFCMYGIATRNGSHIDRCNQCTIDSRNCPPMANCVNEICVCPFGHIFIDDNPRKAVYICKECDTPQDCPAYAECSTLGLCQCKYGVISKDSKTGKVKQCDDDNINPIVLIGIIVPLAALGIGLIAVVTFYFFWRRQFRPFRTVQKISFIKDDKTPYSEEDVGINPAAELSTPTHYVRETPQYDVKYSPKHSDEVEIHPSPPRTSTPAHPEPKPAPPVFLDNYPGKRTPQATPETPDRRTGASSPDDFKADLPVAPMPYYSSEDVSQLPTYHQSQGELRSSPANKRSNTDLRATPVHHPNKVEFQPLPSNDPDSEDDDDEAAVAPRQHEADVQHLAEAKLLSSSTTV